VAFIPVVNTVEVCIVFNGGIKPARVCFNVTSTIAWTLATLQALASDVVDAIIADGFAWMSGLRSVDHLHLQDLTTSSSPSFDWVLGSGSNTLPFTPSNSAAISADQVAQVTTLRTASRGRSFRGRNYWPAVKNGDIANDGATIDGSRTGLQNTFVGSLTAAIHANPNRTLVVVSRFSNGLPRSTGLATPVTSHDTNTLADTQRRRISP